MTAAGYYGRQFGHAPARFKDATKIASNIGRAIGFLFIAGGIFWVFYGNLFNGIWLALIGWFLESAAAGSLRQTLLQDMLKGHAASEIMSTDCQMVSPDLTIEKLVNDNIMASGRRCFPVTSMGGKAEGMITLKDVQKVPREQWNVKQVKDAMTPIEKLRAVTPNEDLNTIMQTLSQNDINQVPVVDDDKVVGIVARDSLVNFINVRTQLGKR